LCRADPAHAEPVGDTQFLSLHIFSEHSPRSLPFCSHRERTENYPHPLLFFMGVFPHSHFPPHLVSFAVPCSHQPFPGLTLTSRIHSRRWGCPTYSAVSPLPLSARLTLFVYITFARPFQELLLYPRCPTGRNLPKPHPHHVFFPQQSPSLFCVARSF